MTPSVLHISFWECVTPTISNTKNSLQKWKWHWEFIYKKWEYLNFWQTITGHGGGIFKDFLIERNRMDFLCRDFHKFSLNLLCTIQIGRLYNTLTHLTFHWYFHLKFGRFYNMQLSHINCQGYCEVGHIKLVSRQSW